MVSQSNSTNIKQSISLESVKISFFYNNSEYKINKYYINDHFFENEFSFEIIENKKVSINFESIDRNARLYIYGIESLSDERLEHDEYGETYLKPSDYPFYLYSKDYYPLIPGLYMGKLISENKIYFLPFKVSPKQVDNNQLDEIKNDLENTMRGLAIDFVKKIYSVNESSSQALPPRILKEFMIIQKHYPFVLSALTDIYKKINYRIQKEYRWVKESRANRIDQVTVRTMQTTSFYDEQLKVPYSAINYDLPENRWIKFIIRNVLSLLDQFLLSLIIYENKLIEEVEELRRYEYQESTRRELIEKRKVSLNLKEYHDLVARMRAGFQMIVSAPWYKEITDKSFNYVPHNLLSDSRYRAIFQLHRDLKKEELSVSIDKNFVYQWKRTDKLYEIWGFTQILKMIIDIGFIPKKGWIYDLNLIDSSLLIPYLPIGEKIVFEKDDIRIHCVYDSSMPIVSHETNMTDFPLYMGKHNRPDCRVDFYKQNIYGGSLIIDFKYRPLNNFWKNSLYNSLNRYKVMEQLIAYKRDSNSPYLFGEIQGEDIRKILSPRPVVGVWVLYPELNKSNSETLFLSEDSISMINMNPGKNHDEIKNKLVETIQFLNERFNKLKSILQ